VKAFTGVARVVVVLGLASVLVARGQTDGAPARSSPAPVFAPHSSVPPALRLIFGLFFPKTIQDVSQLKEYLASDEFAGFRRQYGDVYAVDALFDHAMRLSYDNTYEALFICLVATLEHRRFTISIPLLGPVFSLPLASEFEDGFQVRVNALPGQLYPDSPRGRIGDRDKLQHFFGSAFVAHVFESRDASDRVGGMVEWGEQRFVPDRGPDDRDVRANRQGQEFGLRLLDDRSALPSQFMMLHVKEDQ